MVPHYFHFCWLVGFICDVSTYVIPAKSLNIGSNVVLCHQYTSINTSRERFCVLCYWYTHNNRGLNRVLSYTGRVSYTSQLHNAGLRDQELFTHHIRLWWISQHLPIYCNWNKRKRKESGKTWFPYFIALKGKEADSRSV